MISLSLIIIAQSVNIINLSERRGTDEENADDDKKVVVVLMDDDDEDDDDLKMKGAPSLEMYDGVENSSNSTPSETIREKLSRALGRRIPSSSQMQDEPSEADIEAEINNMEIIDIEEEPQSPKKSWWKALFSRNKVVEDELSEESEGSISAIEIQNDCSGSCYDEDRATCAICLAEYGKIHPILIFLFI